MSEFTRTATMSRSGCETVVVRTDFPKASKQLSTAPVYILTLCQFGFAADAPSRPPASSNSSKEIRPKFVLCGFASSHRESAGLLGSGIESGKFIFPRGESAEPPLNESGFAGGGVECQPQSESVFCGRIV